MIHTLDHHFRCAGRLAIFVLGAAAILAASGCKSQKFANHPVIREVGSAKIGFGEPLLADLPRPEGPYVFAKALSPSVVQLTPAQSTQPEFVRLIGLADEGYPEPKVDAQGKPLPPEDPAVVQDRNNKMKAIKMEGLKAECGANQLWVIRMSQPAPQQPSRVYLLMVETPQPTTGQPLRGDATLINAQVLRKGLANVELNPASTAQPLFDLMLESQLAAMVEAKRKASDPAAAMSNNIWLRFPKMTMPKGPFADRLAEVEKRM